jgi:hypothetical protein
MMTSGENMNRMYKQDAQLELLTAWRDREMDRLVALYANKVLTTTEYNQERREIRKEYNSRYEDILAG